MAVTDKFRKIAALVVLGLYILSPIDLLPELFLPVIGWLDDAAAGVWAIKILFDLRKQQK